MASPSGLGAYRVIIALTASFCYGSLGALLLGANAYFVMGSNWALWGILIGGAIGFAYGIGVGAFGRRESGHSWMQGPRG